MVSVQLLHREERKVVVEFSLNYKTFIASAAFCIGVTVFMISNRWLIIHLNTGQSTIDKKTLAIEKKPLRLYFWKEDAWHYEDTELLWSEDVADTLKYSANRWLSLLDEENLHSKKVVTQSVSLSPSGTIAYLSLDRYPFENESSTYEKYMFIEGLLKTLRAQQMAVTHICFLVHHKPLNDYHLDFSHPWPIKSFFQE